LKFFASTQSIFKPAAAIAEPSTGSNALISICLMTASGQNGATVTAVLIFFSKEISTQRVTFSGYRY